MITYSDLFQFCLVVIGICGLFLQAYKKKYPPIPRKDSGYFLT
jgi:hypothetical protein